MYRDIFAPILLILSGIINLFPKTLNRIVDWGYEPITVQTTIGLLSVLLAIALLSRVKSNNAKSK